MGLKIPEKSLHIHLPQNMIQKQVPGVSAFSTSVALSSKQKNKAPECLSALWSSSGASLASVYGCVYGAMGTSIYRSPCAHT